MTDHGTLTDNDLRAQSRQPVDGAQANGGPLNHDEALDASPESRFGAGASIFDSLDTRSLEMRQRRRPWWKFW